MTGLSIQGVKYKMDRPELPMSEFVKAQEEYDTLMEKLKKKLKPGEDEFFEAFQNDLEVQVNSFEMSEQSAPTKNLGDEIRVEGLWKDRVD